MATITVIEDNGGGLYLQYTDNTMRWQGAGYEYGTNGRNRMASDMLVLLAGERPVGWDGSPDDEWVTVMSADILTGGIRAWPAAEFVALASDHDWEAPGNASAGVVRELRLGKK